MHPHRQLGGIGRRGLPGHPCKLDEGDAAAAAELISAPAGEAAELRQVYAEWPGQILSWLARQGTAPEAIRAARQRLSELLLAEHGRHYDLAAGWDRYTALTAAAAVACHAQDVAAARERVREAHKTWRQVHDYCVDHVYGLLDVAVRLRGENALAQVWNHLMNDWYDDRRPESQAVRAQAPLRRPERGPGNPAAARAPGRSERHASHAGRPSAVRLERVTVRTPLMARSDT